MANALKTVGTVFSVVSTLKAGNEKERVANTNAAEVTRASNYNARLSELEAVQLERKAVAERAVTSHQIAEDKRQARLVISRALAVAGASGGGVLEDVSVLNDISKIAQVGEYNAASTLWTGEQAALSYEDSAVMRRKDADITRYEGQLQAKNIRDEGSYAKSSSRIDAVSTAVGGGMSIYDRYKTNKSAGKRWYA